MNDLERFRAVCRNQKVDYVPIIGLPGACGVGFGGAWGQVYQQLIDTGMPSWVKGWQSETGWQPDAAKSWSDFWGTVTPLTIDSFCAEPAKGIRVNKKTKGNYEVLEYETGAVTRQLINNDQMYSMPEFVKYHVRDWDSWQNYKELNTPGDIWPAERLEEFCKQFDNRDKPLFIRLGSTWGKIRDLAGAEAACMMFYDNPELVTDMVNWQHEIRKKYFLPLIERLKPEILQMGEDCCYKHGMLISPQHFRQYSGPVYKEVKQWAEVYGAEIIVVDTDGDITEFVPLLIEYGVNATYPCEVKSGNNLFELREKYPDFIFFGWLEKEVVNKGNENLIENEIKSKVPELIEQGRYFPNADHSLQPFCTFENLCRFMNLLHKATRNPTGQFHEVIKQEKIS